MFEVKGLFKLYLKFHHPERREGAPRAGIMPVSGDRSLRSI
ncbi:hypothetical protein [Legionella quateirensis]|nr:hypothetical protein [Legionella quateirensis]